MKGKILACLALASLSSQVFALEVYKGHILNHKEWSTGNAKATFNVGKGALKIKALKSDAKVNSNYGDTFAQANPISGLTNQVMSLTGDHQVYVSNNTGSTLTYGYTLSICVDSADHMAQCAYYYDQIELESGGYFNVNEEPILKTVFDTAGIYNTHIGTYLTTDNNSGSFSQSVATSSATIEITDGKK